MTSLPETTRPRPPAAPVCHYSANIGALVYDPMAKRYWHVLPRNVAEWRADASTLSAGNRQTWLRVNAYPLTREAYRRSLKKLQTP